MTLVLGAASEDGFVHLSDRWLTREDLRRPQDMRANKTVVVAFHGFMLAIGYTGPGYLHGRPTDQVIAEAVADCTFEGRFASGGFEVTSPRMLDLWWTVERVRASLNHHLRSVPERFRAGFAVDIVGMHWSRRYTRPLAWSLGMKRGQLTLARETLPLSRSRFALTVEGAGRVHVAGVYRDLRDQKGGIADLADLQDRLLEVFKRVAAAEPTSVGPDAMTVIGKIRDHRPDITVELVKAPPTPASLVREDRRDLEGHTPWILTPGHVMAPSMILGDQALNVADGSGYEVRLRIVGGPLLSTVEEGRPILMMRSQARLGPLGQMPPLEARYGTTPAWVRELELPPTSS